MRLNLKRVHCFPQVFSASNVELVTKQRVEHMTEHDKKQCKKSSSRNPLESFLGMAEKEHIKGTSAADASGTQHDVINHMYNPCGITRDEYFNASVDLKGQDIGRPIEQTTKAQKFKAMLWLCEEYPLSLPEQVRAFSWRFGFVLLLVKLGIILTDY